VTVYPLSLVADVASFVEFGLTEGDLAAAAFLMAYRWQPRSTSDTNSVVAVQF